MSLSGIGIGSYKLWISLSRILTRSYTVTMVPFESLVQSVKKDPDYGYKGRIDEIREKEFPHLGSLSLIYNQTDI